MIKAGLDKITSDLEGAGYTNFHVLYLAPDEADWRDRLTAELEKKVDGICIGFGVRGEAGARCNAQARLIAQSAPSSSSSSSSVRPVVARGADLADIVARSPSTKLCFNTNPPSTLQAVQRNFPMSS